MVTYERLPDNLALTVDAPLAADEAAPVVSADEEFTVVTANLASAPTTATSTSSWTAEADRWPKAPRWCARTFSARPRPARTLAGFRPLPRSGYRRTRSHHIDEYELLRTQFPSDWSVFCQNYDSAFLAWPLYAPHGANRAGLATFSRLP